MKIKSNDAPRNFAEKLADKVLDAIQRAAGTTIQPTRETAPREEPKKKE